MNLNNFKILLNYTGFVRRNHLLHQHDIAYRQCEHMLYNVASNSFVYILELILIDPYPESHFIFTLSVCQFETENSKEGCHLN